LSSNQLTWTEIVGSFELQSVNGLKYKNVVGTFELKITQEDLT